MTTPTTAEQKELDSFRLDEEEQWFLFGDLGVRLETKGDKLIINVMTDRGGDNAKHILNLPPIDAKR